MTSRSFEISLKKGAVGERIVRVLLERNGWVVYQPITDGAHCFDMLSIKDKKRAIAIDVKAKARMNKWAATGVNERHFLEYKAFSETHNMPFWIFFVDELLGKIYGNELKVLEVPIEVEGELYPKTIQWGSNSPKIRYWSLASMKPLADISEEDMKELSSYNQRSYGYNLEE